MNEEMELLLPTQTSVDVLRVTLLWPAQSKRKLFIYILKSYNMYNTCVRGACCWCLHSETDYAGADYKKQICEGRHRRKNFLKPCFTGFCHCDFPIYALGATEKYFSG